MEKMKQLVQRLLSDNTNVVSCLQQINEALLRDYELHYGNYLSILPLQVEIFYVNYQTKPPFVDTNMQCMSSVNHYQPDSDVWDLQSARFGKLYFHLHGRGGIDICLSDSKQYALCSTVKSARINGEDVWGQFKVCERVMQIIGEYENLSGKEEIGCRINRGSDSLQSISHRVEPEAGHVYHIKRGLRRMDKNSSLQLHSFMDIWNKGLYLTNLQRIRIYMDAHPTENALEVIRQQKFRSIPAEVRIRYGIPRSTHL